MSPQLGRIEHMFDRIFANVDEDALVGVIEQLARDEAAVALRDRLPAVAELSVAARSARG